VKQFGRSRGGALRKIALLGQDDRQPTASRVTRDAAPVDAAPNHEKVDEALILSHRILSFLLSRVRPAKAYFVKVHVRLVSF
jgi:hypothetical protein